jgi:hypothetical protein
MIAPMIVVVDEGGGGHDSATHLSRATVYRALDR